MGEATVIRVIQTTLECRGRGTAESPTRIVRQFWTMEGSLLAERDPSLATALERAEAFCEQQYLCPPGLASTWTGAEAIGAALDKLNALVAAGEPGP